MKSLCGAGSKSLTKETNGTAPLAKSREAILKPLNYEPWWNTTPTEKTLKWQTKLSLW